jgi:two-component system CheB/CheR fusion protein
VGGWEFDPRSDTLRGTREFYRITGLPDDEDVGLTTGLALYPPEDRARIRDAVEKCVSDGTPFDIETSIESVDGSRRDVRLQGTAEQTAGRTLRLTGILQDITERKRAWQQVREERNFVDAVLDTIGALVVVLDREGRIVRFNRTCEDVTGYSSAEAKGEAVFDLLIPEEERGEVRDRFDELREGESRFLQNENHWRTKTGEHRLIRWSNTVLTDENDRVEYVIGTGIDITKRRELEREVIAASDEERRRIGEDLHDVLASHLAGTAMMTEGIADQLDDEGPVTTDQVQKVADLIREAGEQARCLSHSLMPLEVEDNDLAIGLQKLAERQEEMRDLTCSFEAGDSVPTLRGEKASHLYRIASEAVNNAVKHANPKTITIRLTVEDDGLVLAVEDDGIGIPEHVESTDGLGLHIMRYRANLIGAHLQVGPDAEKGGTCVRCRLPLEQGDPTPKSPDESDR